MKTDSDLKHSLRREAAAELQKDADAIAPELIDRRIHELCVLEGIQPPALSGKAIDAALSKIKVRAAMKRLTQETQRKRSARIFRWAVAACFLVFFANYAAALLTGKCLPAQAGVKICCGTPFCPCKVEKEK